MKCPHCNGTGELQAEQVHVGTMILSMRRARAMTQEDLGKLIGMSRSQIANIEIGRSDMPIRTLARFAEALNVSMKELVP